MARRKGSNQLLPFDTIKEAVSGNEEALSDVIRHYDRVITALASETILDENGGTHVTINEELKTRIQNRLIEGVTMRFDLHWKL